MGAKAIVTLDREISDVFQGLAVISATGIAVIMES
jgi:uncharacterized protein YbjQ (UPF0145 family)